MIRFIFMESVFLGGRIMELKDAIINRHSIRGFTNQSVSKEIVEDILKTAGYAVSSKNT